MKVNVVGMIGGIIALISLALPWWIMTVSARSLGVTPANVSIYPFQVTVSSGGVSITAQVDIWYGWVALVLVVIGGLLGIAGSIEQKTKGAFFMGGALALLSIIVFGAGLQGELSSSTVIRGWPAIGLFSSGTLSGVNYAAYLSYGFWLALAAAIIMLAASLIKPGPRLSQPPPPTSTTEKTSPNEPDSGR